MFTRAQLFDLAQRSVGTEEVAGTVDSPQVMAMLKLDNHWPQNDEVPWCSAFANYIAWLARAPRSKNLRARSWLEVIAGQVAVPRIALQQSLAFQIPTDTQRQDLGQSGKLGAARRLHPAEAQRAVVMLDIHPTKFFPRTNRLEKIMNVYPINSYIQG